MKTRLLISTTLLTLAFAGCAAEELPTMTKEEARANAIASGKADHIDWCEIFDWYGDGICDEFCSNPDPDCTTDDECFVGGCSGQVCSDQPGVITTCEFLPEYACYQQATCERQADGACGFTMTDELSECLAPTPSCEGTLVEGDSTFDPAGDGFHCESPQTHCLTDDFGQCPQFLPLPPDFCSEGTVVQGPSSYVPAAGGDGECEIPSVHCLTDDFGACPQLSPLPADYCSEGTIVQGTKSYIPSTDGMECELPSIYCVPNDDSICQ